MRNNEVRALTTKKRLAYFLGCTARMLGVLISDRHYYVFHSEKNGKRRKCEVPDGPNGLLKKAHETVKNALREETMPDWVYSCRNKDYVKNARRHAREKIYMLNMDVSKFYPSCTRHYVLQLFADKNFYGLQPDIAEMLSKILTYKDHIPTGSPASSYLAFWSYYNCFEEIYRYSRAHGFDMSLYVDDMTFSSEKKPSKWFVKTISKILERYGLSVNLDKTKLSGPRDEKEVTGVRITPSGRMLPTKDLLMKYETEEKIPEEQRNPRRLAGLKASINRIPRQ